MDNFRNEWTINFDVDIDMRDRDEFLSTIPHIVGSIEKDGVYTKHNTGVYFQNIPVFPLENFSAIDHKAAEEAGYFKVDFLNNSVYDNIESMDIIQFNPGIIYQIKRSKSIDLKTPHDS